MISSGQPVYTEEVAGTKWCPAAMKMKCYGSNCMAWRWKPLMADDDFADAVKKAAAAGPMTHAKAVAHVMAHKADYGLPTTPFLGYCGLAGGFLT